MQFDRDSEEIYQEKRTKLGGVVLAQILPIEIHASKIYTRAMFEFFGEMLYEGDDPTWSARGSSQTCAGALDKGCKGYTPSRVTTSPKGPRSSQVILATT